MDPHSDGTDVPKRSNLWVDGISQVKFSGDAYDKISAIIAIALAVFSLIIFWPIVSQINFEEAFFTPLVPFLISGIGFFGAGVSDALRLLFIISFMVSTVGVYLLTLDLTRRQITAILASVIYLIPPIPVFVLTFIRRGLLDTELGSAKSFFTIVYGDGAHFLALAMIPYAVIFVLRYLKFGKKADLILSVIFCSLILLANASQSFSLGIILFVIILTQIFFGNARSKFKRLLNVVVLSIGLVSFWYTPNFWYTSSNFAGSQFFSNLQLLFPLPLILFLLTLFFSFVFFARREDRMAIFVSFLIFVMFAGICASWLISGRSFLPHPHRMLSDLNMFGAVVVAVLLTPVVDSMQFVNKFGFGVIAVFGRIAASIIFGIVSFIILSVATYVLSPFAILAVSGPRGIWTKIRFSVLTDRQETLSLAGGNFNLVSERGSSWQIWFGAVVSVIFLIVLLWIILKDTTGEEEAV